MEDGAADVLGKPACLTSRAWSNIQMSKRSNVECSNVGDSDVDGDSSQLLNPADLALPSRRFARRVLSFITIWDGQATTPPKKTN